MIKKFVLSYKLTKEALKVIMKEKEILAYALLSLISEAIIIFSFNYGFNFEIDTIKSLDPNMQNIITYGFIFFTYLVLFFITYFFNCAILSTVKNILDWKENKFGDGIKTSMDNISYIFQWSVVSATVSVILKFIENLANSENGIAKLIGTLLVKVIWITWAVSTFFVFPIMILEKKWVKDAIKESSHMFKDTWGERAILDVGTWLFFFVLSILVVIISIPMFQINIILWVISLSVLLVILFISSNAIWVVLNMLIYSVAKKETLPEWIDWKILNKMISSK